MINDWGLTYNTTHAVAANKRRTNEKETFAVKLCPECNCVYEMTRDQYKNTTKAHFYEDFPRRGLYRQKCLKCRMVYPKLEIKERINL